MKIIKNIFLFIVYLIAIAFVLEYYFRASGISLPAFFYDSKNLGRTQNAGMEIFKAGPDKFCIDKVNKYGYTGNGYPSIKEPGNIRIALFGASYVEGLQVFRRNRFSTILENELSEKLNKKVEVLNFGIGGEDFRGMYFRYLKMGKEYQPDYSIFIIESMGLYEDKTIPGPDIYVENDSLNISYAFLNNSASRLRDDFRLVRNSASGNLFKDAFSVYYGGRLPSVIFEKVYMFFKKKEPDVEPNQNNYLLTNKKIIDYLTQQNRINGNNIIIVNMDILPTFYENYFKINKLPEIDLNTYLNQQGGQKILNYWKASGTTGHWNNFAHHLVGEFLVNKVYSLIETNSSRVLQSNNNKK